MNRAASDGAHRLLRASLAGRPTVPVKIVPHHRFDEFARH